MFLVEILLPLYDNEGRRFGAGEFDRVSEELAGRFGGVTAFRRSPAEGVWREGGGESRDDSPWAYRDMAAVGRRISRAYTASRRYLDTQLER